MSASTALEVSDGGSEGSLGALEYQPRGVLGPTPQLLFLFAQLNMADAVGEYSTVSHSHPGPSVSDNGSLLQLILMVVIEVTTFICFFSLARHDPLMVHSTRTS